MKRTYRPANSPRDKFGPVVPAPAQPRAEPASAPMAPPVEPVGPPHSPPSVEPEAVAEPDRLPVPAGDRLPAKRRKRFAPRNTTRNTVIAMLVAMVVICGGGITAVGWYFFGDDVTAKPRSPIETVEGFMQAAFNQRDDETLGEYVCSNVEAKAEVRKVINDLRTIEKQYNVTFDVEWEEFDQVSNAGGKATVTTKVTPVAIVQGGQRQRYDTERWTFSLVDRGDWQVCGLDTGESP